MREPQHRYLMENPDETLRLETKTNANAVRLQASWCGLKPGMRVLDAACGPGNITAILHEMVQPGGEIMGLDASEERTQYATKRYGNLSGIRFRVHDLMKPLEEKEYFDLIWVRFLLEYFKVESPDIVRNLSACLKPGGSLCFLDLDNNSLNHFELPVQLEDVFKRLMRLLEQKHDFDPYAGRKLYSYLYDLGYKDIEVDVSAHHLIYGDINEPDMFNWMKKVEVVSTKNKQFFNEYPGGQVGFVEDFKRFFRDPRRFSYTPLILCKGTKPA